MHSAATVKLFCDNALIPEVLLRSETIQSLLEGSSFPQVSAKRICHRYNTGTALLYADTNANDRLVIKVEPTAKDKKLVRAAHWMSQRTSWQHRYIPQVYAIVQSPEIDYVIMSHEPGATLREIILTGSTEGVSHACEHLVSILCSAFYKPSASPLSLDAAQTWYIDRGRQRLQELCSWWPSLTEFVYNRFLLNGQWYEGPWQLLSRLGESLAWWFSSDYLVDMHGDPTFENVLFDPATGIKLLDPNGSLVGPLSYDLGKISMSIYGRYDLIHEELYTLEQHPSGVFALRFSPAPGLDALEKTFPALVERHAPPLLDPLWYNRSKLTASIHLLCSAAHHRLKPKNSLAMLLQGTKLLHEQLTLQANSR